MSLTAGDWFGGVQPLDACHGHRAIISDRHAHRCSRTRHTDGYEAKRFHDAPIHHCSITYDSVRGAASTYSRNNKRSIPGVSTYRLGCDTIVAGLEGSRQSASEYQSAIPLTSESRRPNCCDENHPYHAVTILNHRHVSLNDWSGNLDKAQIGRE